MGKTASKSRATSNVGFVTKITERMDKLRMIVLLFFFVGVWGVLSFYENATLFRISDLSLFLFDEVYFNEMLSVPAGLLMYVSSFFVQFFHYPVLGATIYIALLYLVYRLTIKIFEIPKRYCLLALIPVTALLAANTQLGYWIFYLKIPGYYYVVLLAVLAILMALWHSRSWVCIGEYFLFCHGCS